MVEMHIILALFFFSFFSVFDFIIFNEESLLALCFFAFLFYCFNALSTTAYSSFESRASKFEQDLLVSFNFLKSSLILQFDSALKRFKVSDHFLILKSVLLAFTLKGSETFLTKMNWLFYQVCFVKLNELAVFYKNFTISSQKISINCVLYSLLLKKFNITKTATKIFSVFALSPTKKFTNLNTLKSLSC